MIPDIAALEALGLTREQIAYALGVEKGTVSNWASGTRAPSGLLQADLRELSAVVHERVQAGMDVHEAVSRWAPTVYYSTSGGVTRTPNWGMLGYWRSSTEADEAAALRLAVACLAEEVQQPMTAERAMIIRRLALQIQITIEGHQTFGGLEDR